MRFNHENIDHSSYKIVFFYDFPYILIFGVKVDLRVELLNYKSENVIILSSFII